MKTTVDIANELNEYIAEINEAIEEKFDELIGLYRSGSLLSEVFVDRRRPDVFSSFINLSVDVTIDCNKPFSKKLIIEQSIVAIQQIQGLLKDTVEKLRGT